MGLNIRRGAVVGSMRMRLGMDVGFAYLFVWESTTRIDERERASCRAERVEHRGQGERIKLSVEDRREAQNIYKKVKDVSKEKMSGAQNGDQQCRPARGRRRRRK